MTDEDDLMIINRSGIVIRIGVENLRVMGRATQGVRLITLKGNDAIASVTKVEHQEEELFEGDEVESPVDLDSTSTENEEEE